MSGLFLFLVFVLFPASRDQHESHAERPAEHNAQCRVTVRDSRTQADHTESRRVFLRLHVRPRFLP